jgi:hypothetical protein
MREPFTRRGTKDGLTQVARRICTVLPVTAGGGTPHGCDLCSEAIWLRRLLRTGWNYYWQSTSELTSAGQDSPRSTRLPTD